MNKKWNEYRSIFYFKVIIVDIIVWPSFCGLERMRDTIEHNVKEY